MKTEELGMKQIMVHFDEDGCVTWGSGGWSNDAELMKMARRAIAEGMDESEVIENLQAAGFVVIIATVEIVED